MASCYKKFFKAKEVREKYPSVTLTSKQFKDFVTRVDENICSMQEFLSEFETQLEHGAKEYFAFFNKIF